MIVRNQNKKQYSYFESRWTNKTKKDKYRKKDNPVFFVCL